MTVAFTPSAPLVVYRNEITLGFQRRQKLLYNSVLTQFQAKGYQAVFEVADTGNDYAVTRGANGFVPSSTFTQAQYTATMQMQFAKDVRNKEDILGSQGDIERVMTEAAIGKINRSIDKVILDQLDAGTQVAWSSAPLTSISTDTFAALLAKLTAAKVPMDGNITAVIQPSVFAQLYKLPNFANELYVGKTPTPELDLKWQDEQRMYRWMGINFIVMPNLTGAGTSSETNYIYHKNAVGLAADLSGQGTPTVDAGYDQQNSYYFVNANFYMGAKVIQDTGIYKFYTDGTSLVNVPA